MPASDSGDGSFGFESGFLRCDLFCERELYNFDYR